MKKISLISPSILLIVLFSFFLSFFTIKCDKEELVKIKGTDFVIGKELKLKNPINQKIIIKDLKPNFWAIASFASIILSIIIFFSYKNFCKHILIAFFSFISILSLLILRQNIKTEIENNKELILDLHTNWSFIFIITLLFLNIIVCVYMFFNKKISKS